MLTTEHLPESHTGQRFCKFFDHRFNFIKSSYSSTPEWITVSDYPIEHRNLWSAYQDPERLIGLSFGTTTHYAVLDIDRRSPYHPGNSESEYRELLGAYEEVGISSAITLQSSYSGGLHIYFVFPKALPTFNLARMLRLTATRAGYEVKDGQLEIFPNTKSYSKHSKTAYKPLRLPLQQGSYLVDKDFVPYSNDVEVFLNQAEAAAEEQDIELVEIAIESASHIKYFRRVKGDGDASSFAQDLKEQIGEGWTGFGQTNDLLRVIGTYGRVFKGLEGQALADYIVQKAEGSPGYWQYCQHRHNIHRRGKDWGRCIEKYYYPYGSEPIRSGTFKELQKSGSRPENSPKENIVNQSRQKGAIKRIEEGMEYLRQKLKVLPTKVGELKEALLGAIKKIFGTRTSDKTLYRYKECWHPKYIQPAAPGIASQPIEIIKAEPVTNQIGVVTEKGKNRTLREETIEEEVEQDTTANPLVGDVKPVIEQKVDFVSKDPEPLPRQASSSCHTPPGKSTETGEQKRGLKPSQCKASKVYATPLSYMKVYVLSSCANGLLSKKVFGRESSLKLCSISAGSEVRLCRGSRHSRHPELVYVKPCCGSEDWIGGIAVPLSSLTLLDDS